jgi:two-component system, response regulator FlrC
VSIVVVEDDAGLRSAMRETLKQEGFVVESFANSTEALEHLGRNPVPTLILLDLDLPGMGGAAFRARQLADPRLCGVPVIVTSADRDGGAAHAERLDASDFLAKPFSPEELLHVVQNRAVTLTRSEHFLRGALRGRRA